MNYWLLKSEPDVWSIDQQKKTETKSTLGWSEKLSSRKNLKSMKKGDQCFFIILI